MTSTFDNLKQSPRLARLQALFDKKYGFSRDLIGRAMINFGPGWASDFEAVLNSLCADDEALENALKGYASFAIDSMRRQKRFETSRQYPNREYSVAARDVYFNDHYMMMEYLPGLLLSHFLWPHHYRQLQFFDSAFLAPMALSTAPRFAEVGVGTGLYSRRILSRLSNAVGSGYDISPSSCAFAEHHMRVSGVDDRFTMFNSDLGTAEIDAVNWLVCVELLEHLEDPVRFLRGLREHLAPGGKAFITAALNAAHADHIYLYSDAEEVRNHLQEAGFLLEQFYVAAAYAPIKAGVPVPLAAAFVVY